MAHEAEHALAVRMMTDLSLITSGLVVSRRLSQSIGFERRSTVQPLYITYEVLDAVFNNTPGLSSDKLKAVLSFAWDQLKTVQGVRGIVFAYDEAQTLSDQAAKDQYPLSLLLEVFQSLQRQGLPLMLVLAGLPTLFPKLVEARTFSERMFRVLFLDRLSESESRDAILKPIADAKCPVKLAKESVRTIITISAGYPYFIQFICREVYDAFLQQVGRGAAASVPSAEIERKLDADFFAGRWARTSDRQRDLLYVVATLEQADGEFTVQEIVEASHKLLQRGFNSSHANQTLKVLQEQGLVYRTRHGRYRFAVPLLERFILRQAADPRSGLGIQRSPRAEA
jgi:type II secretory pathway predicted ATPase ExeA